MLKQVLQINLIMTPYFDQKKMGFSSRASQTCAEKKLLDTLPR
jgi:hypothetical protein